MTVRILLVEDEPGYARFLREVLLAEETRDHTLTWAESLEDATAQLTNGSFDIVLLDLGLPDADGIEALQVVTAQSPSTPVVVLSSLADLEMALRSMRLGAQEYLVKGQSEHLLLPRALRHAIERKRLQDVAAGARAEAERANAAKDEFLAMLGHELRNPLAPIVTALSLIRRRTPTGIERELTIVERQVDNVVRLVDDLLDVARITRGRLDLQVVDVDLADVVALGVETTAPLFTQRKHTLTVSAPRGRCLVRGDRVRLAQVVANLLSNAARYTEPGGAIHLSADREGDFVTLRVRDNGIGMSPELLTRAFGLFEQGAQALDRSTGGLGLGLAIVKNIVSLHGGSVAAASDGPGRGSELTVRLPHGADALLAVAEPAPSKTAPAPQSRRVLIVDDNEDAAEMLQVGLQYLGHVVRRTNDGESALAIIDAFKPEVALLDIGLPAMDGYVLAERIRQLLGAQAPVIVAVTGYGRDADRVRSKAAGFDHHLVKPIEFDTLAAIISSLGR